MQIFLIAFKDESKNLKRGHQLVSRLKLLFLVYSVKLCICENHICELRSEELFEGRSSQLYRSFSLSRNKKKIGNRTVEEAKKVKCYIRLIYKQFVSGLCGAHFLSYLPKRFTHPCRALYGDAVLVYRFGAPVWPTEINKNIWSSLFLSKLFLFTRELAYVRLKISSNT